MRILGLTGGIACGKSNVSSALKELGAVIVDGDVLSRELTAPGGPALPLLRQAFGDGIFTAAGELDRKRLGSLVFSDDRALETLNGIMIPLLRRLILERAEQARRQGAEVCVLDMPLLYEQDLDSLCDRVWCVYIPREEELRRLMERDGFSREQAEQRLRSQMDPREKASRADVVIDTSGTPEETRAKIPGLYARETGRSGE